MLAKRTSPSRNVPFLSLQSPFQRGREHSPMKERHALHAELVRRILSKAPPILTTGKVPQQGTLVCISFSTESDTFFCTPFSVHKDGCTDRQTDRNEEHLPTYTEKRSRGRRLGKISACSSGQPVVLILYKATHVPAAFYLALTLIALLI